MKNYEKARSASNSAVNQELGLEVTCRNVNFAFLLSYATSEKHQKSRSRNFTTFLIKRLY